MPEIHFSQQELAQIANNIESSTEALKQVQKTLTNLKAEFNKTNTTLVQNHWDKRVNNEHLKKLNDTATNLIDEIDENFSELAQRQENVAQLLTTFAQENATNEEESAAAINAEETN